MFKFKNKEEERQIRWALGVMDKLEELRQERVAQQFLQAEQDVKKEIHAAFRAQLEMEKVHGAVYEETLRSMIDFDDKLSAKVHESQFQQQQQQQKEKTQEEKKRNKKFGFKQPITGTRMPRNIEIKLKLKDRAKLIETIDQLTDLSVEGKEPYASINWTQLADMKQVDTFFKSEKGRLKLRYITTMNAAPHGHDGKPKAELIWYDRKDEKDSGPKKSEYKRVSLRPSDVEDTIVLLEQTTGSKAIKTVKKIRTVILVSDEDADEVEEDAIVTRIHIDQVEGLGDFMEIEVVLPEDDDETYAEGQKIMDRMIDWLKLDRNDFMTGAYADLLE